MLLPVVSSRYVFRPMDGIFQGIHLSKYLEQQVTDVEAAGHPALDSLTQTISTSNLERVRRIKNRMVRLSTRIETLKEVLEKTLDDDSDMKDFNLSALEEERQEYLNKQALRASSSTPFDMPLTISGSLNLQKLSGTPQGGAMTAKSSSGSSETSLDDDEDVEVVEQLLESYFMRLDNTWNRLQTLTEYVDDTEDFINIELDSHRNQLIRLDIVLTCFTACMGLITAVTALFAMNVELQPGQDEVPYRWFVIDQMVTIQNKGAFPLMYTIRSEDTWDIFEVEVRPAGGTVDPGHSKEIFLRANAGSTRRGLLSKDGMRTIKFIVTVYSEFSPGGSLQLHTKSAEFHAFLMHDA